MFRLRGFRCTDNLLLAGAVAEDDDLRVDDPVNGVVSLEHTVSTASPPPLLLL